MSPSYAHAGVFLARTSCLGRRRPPARRSWRGGLIADARPSTAQEIAREGRPGGFGVAMRMGADCCSAYVCVSRPPARPTDRRWC
jgi:hypothetical protein